MKASLIPVDEAREAILSRIEAPNKSAKYSLIDSLNKVLAEDVYSNTDIPPADNSAMDGIVINFSDFHKLDSRIFEISSVIQAGDVPENLPVSCASRIYTGAVLPENADTVIPVEDCRFFFDESSGQECVEILVKPVEGNHVRPRGQDIKSGQKVFSRGNRLKPQDIGLLASLGLGEVLCQKPLKVGLVSTGNELLRPGEENKAGKIFNSNQFMLSALLHELGFEVLMFDVLADDLKQTQSVLLDIAKQCDCIISTGGVSVGGADFVKQALETVGELAIWRLAIKPGKPFVFGRIEGKPFFGLPGNPVAVFVTFSFLVKPALFKMLGVAESKQMEFLLPADFSVKANKTRQEYLRVSLEGSGENQKLRLFENQSSGVLSSLSYSDGLAIVPIGVEVKNGDKLRFIPYPVLNN